MTTIISSFFANTFVLKITLKCIGGPSFVAAQIEYYSQVLNTRWRSLFCYPFPSYKDSPCLFINFSKWCQKSNIISMHKEFSIYQYLSYVHL